MKYCSKCGAQIHDEAVICVNCGCVVDESKFNNVSKSNSRSSTSATLKTIAKIFMLISCAIIGIYFIFFELVFLVASIEYGFELLMLFPFFFLLPLAWMIPMTVRYFKLTKNNEPVSTAFKICCLLFVNIIAGILMLCDNEPNN